MHRELYVHPGALDTLRTNPNVVLSGRDAAARIGTPVDAQEVDAYVRRRDAESLVRRLRAREASEAANVHLHVVDDDV